MDSAIINAHLAANHAPLFLLASAAALILLGVIGKNDSFTRLGFFVVFLSGVTTIGVVYTGSAAQELVQELEGVDPSLIGNHEETAHQAALPCYVLSVIALVALLVCWKRANLSRAWLLVLPLLAAVGVVAALFVVAAHRGGHIIHAELRPAETVRVITGEQREWGW